MSLVDLFASRDNAHLPPFFARYPCPQAEGVDALSSPWPSGLLYASPPLLLLPRLIRKILTEQADVIFVAPHWPHRAWFADLLKLSVGRPWWIPEDRIALSQAVILHPEPQWLQLTTWCLRGTC